MKISDDTSHIKSNILTYDDLKSFSHTVRAINCNLCSNHCRLTVNQFDGNRKFIGGNRCEKPLVGTGKIKKQYNIYDYKKELLEEYKTGYGSRGKIGIPMGLNMYEMLPFWHSFFTSLGFELIVSPPSTRDLYLLGQHTIPSDTICYPAKILHGHIEALLKQGLETIFYPCMTYNLDEKISDNHYNCPVVAYYPEVIKANIPDINQILFIHDYIGIHRKKDFMKRIHIILKEHFPEITFPEIKTAVESAFNEYYLYMKKIRQKGKEYLEIAKQNDLHIIVLAGRPYHLDDEINHGIDQLIAEFGAVIVSEDAIYDLSKPISTDVLNQWTYHSRLYSAANYIAKSNNLKMNLVQLVSFGCGVDAITTDEVRSILEDKGRIYTQIKIDEIANLGAVKIRLRSLFAALEQISGGDPLEKTKEN